MSIFYDAQMIQKNSVSSVIFRHQLPALTLIVVAIVLGFSIWTLPTFPPLSIDETGLCAVANNYMNTHRVIYPHHQNVMDPRFAILSGMDDFGLRAPCYFILGVVQKVIGINYVATRGFVFTIWVLIGMLIFQKIRKELNTNAACLALVIWVFSLDGFLLSHLIRFDIFVTLNYIFLLLLMTHSSANESSSAWFWAGTLGPLTFFGFHLHGILLWGLTIIGFFLHLKKSVRPVKHGFMMILGMALGAAATLPFIDPISFALGRHSMASSIISATRQMWLERLQPWNFVADTVFYFINPDSFYIHPEQMDLDLWRASSLVSFCAYFFGAGWVLFLPTENRFVKLMAWLFLFVSGGLALGAARQEFVYRVLPTIAILPVLSWVILNSYEQLTLKNIFFGLGLFGLMWVFRTNLLFFCLLFILSLSLRGVDDKKIILVACALLTVVFCMWLRNKDLASVYIHIPWQRWLQPGFLLLLMLSACALILGLWKEKRKTGQLIQLFILLWFMGFNIYASVVEVGRLSLRNRSLTQTFKVLDKMTGVFAGRVLGPSYLWFWKADRFDDIGAIVMDYYYSGQKRPQACLARAKPEILVIDDEFKGRYLVKKDPQNRQLALVPLSSLISAPFTFLGTVPGCLHHSNLDVFKIDWPSKPSK